MDSSWELFFNERKLLKTKTLWTWTSVDLYIANCSWIVMCLWLVYIKFHRLFFIQTMVQEGTSSFEERACITLKSFSSLALWNVILLTISFNILCDADCSFCSLLIRLKLENYLIRRRLWYLQIQQRKENVNITLT